MGRRSGRRRWRDRAEKATARSCGQRASSLPCPSRCRFRAGAQQQQQGRAVRAKPAYGGDDHDDEKRCSCDLVAALRTVTKDGPNQGRSVRPLALPLMCHSSVARIVLRLLQGLQGLAVQVVRGRGSSCGEVSYRSAHSFEWTDGEAAPRAPAGGGATGGNVWCARLCTASSSALSSAHSYRCNEVGHFANSCPNQPVPGGSRSQGGAGAAPAAGGGGESN